MNRLKNKKGHKNNGLYSTVLNTMSLDDMLEASTALDLIKHKQDIPVIKSESARQYVHIAVKFKKNEKIVDNMINSLADKIVCKNSSELACIKADKSFSRVTGIESIETIKPLVVKTNANLTNASKIGKIKDTKYSGSVPR